MREESSGEAEMSLLSSAAVGGPVVVEPAGLPVSRAPVG